MVLKMEIKTTEKIISKQIDLEDCEDRKKHIDFLNKKWVALDYILKELEYINHLGDIDLLIEKLEPSKQTENTKR